MNWNGSKRQSQLMLELTLLKKQARTSPNIDAFRRKCLQLKDSVQVVEQGTEKMKMANSLFRHQKWIDENDNETASVLRAKLKLAMQELLKRDRMIEMLSERTEQEAEEIAKAHRNEENLRMSVEDFKKEVIELQEYKEQADRKFQGVVRNLVLEKRYHKTLDEEKKKLVSEIQRLKNTTKDLNSGMTFENLMQENSMMMSSVAELRTKVEKLTTELSKANSHIREQDMEIHKAMAYEPDNEDGEKYRQLHIHDLLDKGHVTRALGSSLHHHAATRTIAKGALNNFLKLIERTDINPMNPNHAKICRTVTAVKMVQKLSDNLHSAERELNTLEKIDETVKNARRALEKLTPDLGVVVEASKSPDPDETWVLLKELDVGGSAKRAGLKEGMRLTHIGTDKIESKKHFDELIASKKAGNDITVTVMRENHNPPVIWHEDKFNVVVGCLEKSWEEVEALGRQEHGAVFAGDLKKDDNEKEDEVAPVPIYDVFLGGSCNPTTWRSDYACPELKKFNVTYYNPQRDDWSPALVALEAHVKESCRILLFVIDKQTRAIASMLEAAEYIAAGRNVVLAINKIPEGCRISDEEVVGSTLKDLNRARDYLSDTALRHGCPYFTDENSVQSAIHAVVQKAKELHFIEGSA